MKHFYGKKVLVDQEHEHIEQVLEQFKGEPATEELKEKIWNLLQAEKHAGNILTPFKITLAQDPSGQFPPQIEVLLDTKV